MHPCVVAALQEVSGRKPEEDLGGHGIIRGGGFFKDSSGLRTSGPGHEAPRPAYLERREELGRWHETHAHVVHAAVAVREAGGGRPDDVVGAKYRPGVALGHVGFVGNKVVCYVL